MLFRTGGQAKKQLDGHTNKVCLIDEWALVDPIITKTLQDGQAAFRDSLIVKISTAQYDVGSDNHKYWIARRKALYEGTLPDNVFLFLCEPDEEDINKLVSTVNSKYITILDDEYPEFLKYIYRPPFVIYYKGDISLLDNQLKSISVVGSRKCSEYGAKACQTLVKELSKEKHLK